MSYVSVKPPDDGNKAFDMDKANYVSLYDVNEPETIPVLSMFTKVYNFDTSTLTSYKFQNSMGLMKQVFPDNEVLRVAFPLSKVDESGNKIYTGLSFLSNRRNEETQAWEQTELFKQGSSKQEGIWRTNLSNDMLQKQYVNIVIVKSPIEAIALKTIGKIPNSIYVSTMGKATKGQIRQIRGIENNINKSCKSRVIISFSAISCSIFANSKIGKENKFGLCIGACEHSISCF